MRRWRQRKGVIGWLQVGSGVYLAFFFINHIGAVLVGRSVLSLDTNFYFAAAGFYVAPFQYVFAPYYFLAVVALFTHIGCALCWRLSARSPGVRAGAVALPMALGGVVALTLVLMLAGVLFPVEIPPEYKATYESCF